MKRGIESVDHTGQNGASTSQEEGAGPQAKVQVTSWDDDDDQPVLQPTRKGSQVRRGSECPYLDTVSRQVSQQLPSPVADCENVSCLL